MTYEERLNEVKRMDDEVRNFNDEDLIMRWLMVGVPDEASEDDYEWFANDAPCLYVRNGETVR